MDDQHQHTVIQDAAAARPAAFDVAKVRDDFPILKQKVYDHPLVYLDNAATSQKPQIVIDRISRYYEEENANIHRGVHHLSQLATQLYEDARESVREFIKAPASHEVIYTSGTTESINLVAYSWGRRFIGEGDEILLSTMEHHSNIVPWQLISEEVGARLRVIPVNDRGELEMDVFRSMLNDRTKLVAIPHVSNSLGTINPVEAIVSAAHEASARVLIDGAQAVPHMEVDVQSIGCDFYCFSGHKMFGPTGIGILYGREQLLEDMPPFQGGGDMIKEVRFEKTIYNDLPHKLEAGTPNIAGGIGLGAAVQYMNSIGRRSIAEYEAEMLAYATDALSRIPDLRIIGTAENKASVISFLIGDIHPYDAGTLLDRLGIAIRTGHHCTQPLMSRYGIPGTMRASFAFYNDRNDIDILVAGVNRVREIF